MRYLISIVSFMMICSPVFAQLPPPEPVPIDGGIGALLAAGIGLGVHKMRQMRNKNTQ
jgi:hypothetical protein